MSADICLPLTVASVVSGSAFRLQPEARWGGFQCISEDFVQPLCFAETGVDGNTFNFHFCFTQQPTGGGWAIEVSDNKNSKFSLDIAVAGMKEKGILSKDNLSEPSKGIFQSDTGEIIMRTKENLLKIVTARSEAVTLEANKGEKLGQLNVVNTSIPGMIAACAIDKEKLADSKRIVLIFSTEAVNSGMELSSDRVTLVDLGKPPVLIRSGKLDITLDNSNGAKMSLYSLGFDGTRREKLPFKFDGKTLNISVDTRTLKDGPTPFFELVAE